jgi:hypothetical protein
MVKIYIVSWGYYFITDAEYSYSYWDFDVAMRTFVTYQAMVPDWINFTVYIPEGEDV